MQFKAASFAEVVETGPPQSARPCHDVRANCIPAA